MAQYTHNSIYSYVADAINTQSRAVYCVGVYEPTPKSFPCAYIHETDHRPMRDAVTLSFTDEQLLGSWEVQVFSNLTDGALSEAYDIMADVEIAFKQLYFIETFCSQVQNIDPSVTRVVARFTRVYGDNDHLPETD